MMEELINGYNDPELYPNHKLIAIVEHAANYNINQLKLFFITVQNELKVNLCVGDGISAIIDSKKYIRFSLYSNEEPMICLQYPDGIYRLQEPIIKRQQCTFESIINI